MYTGKRIGTEVVVAMKTGILGAISCPIARRILLLSLVPAMTVTVMLLLFAATTSAKHLVKEAKLRRNGSEHGREGEQNQTKRAHVKRIGTDGQCEWSRGGF